MYLPFSETADQPHFKPHIKEADKKEKQNGFTLYYTNQCPFTAKYVPLIEEYAKGKNIELEVVHFNTAEQAQNGPCPFTTFNLFYNGELVTHEILSEKKFEKILEEKGLI